MSDLIVIADYGDLCGECPVWDGSGSLFWTDIAGRRFYRYHQPSGRHEILHEGLQINGFRLNASGGFVITNTDGAWLWNGADSPALIAREVNGSKLQFNDCIADPLGRLYAGTCFYDANAEYEMGKLIRLDTDGQAVVIDEGFHMANGLGFSPDSGTLYFTDSGARCIYAYDYQIKTGEIGNRRIVVRVPATEGLPDGMTIDAEGFIWSAQWFGSCVVRYDPDGNVERRISVPAKQTSAITFGGNDLTDIFITSAAKTGSLPIMPPGYNWETGYFGGRLYRLNVGIKGKVEHKAAISISEKQS
jgi:D-xylono/L-arabinono-1,4-lactonase